MPKPIRDLGHMLKSCTPVLHDRTYVYAQVPAVQSLEGLDVFALIREEEGVTAILEETLAVETGLEIVFRAARITLNVFSALDGVGLTAAFSAVLAERGISCNVIAGIHHDHIFVPLSDAKDALDALLAMQGEAAGKHSA